MNVVVSSSSSSSFEEEVDAEEDAVEIQMESKTDNVTADARAMAIYLRIDGKFTETLGPEPGNFRHMQAGLFQFVNAGWEAGRDPMGAKLMSCVGSMVRMRGEKREKKIREVEGKSEKERHYSVQ